MEKTTELSVVIPVYNAEATVYRVVDELIRFLRPIYTSIDVILVNDGSKDGSLREIQRCRQSFPEQVRWIDLSRNFGEHNAVMCGLREIRGQCVAIMDDDGQNSPGDIPRLVEKLDEGFDVVFSTYQRKQHSWLRNIGSRFNDWVATWTLGKPANLYLSSFKVMRTSIVRQVVGYTGPFPYIDGLILLVTRSLTQVPCTHSTRMAGTSNYGVRKLVSLWLNMATGFSVLPLRMVTALGWFTSLAALAMTIFFVLSWLTGGIIVQREIPPGWASLIVSVTFFAGVQLLVMGMLGEYLGRIYLHGNGIPQFVVRARSGSGKEDSPCSR